MVSITVAPDALPKMKTQSFQRLGHINAHVTALESTL